MLRLSLPWIVGPLLIEPLMGRFLDSYPDIRLDLVFNDGLVDIAAEGFDAGVRIGELLEKDMIAVRIGGPMRMAVLASPTYLAEFGMPQRPADLARHRCIAYRFASTRAISSWDLIENGREIAFTPDPRLSANTMPLVVEAAAQGVGLAYTIEHLARRRLEEGSLLKVLEPFLPALDPLHLYYPSRRLIPTKLRAFIDFLRAEEK